MPLRFLHTSDVHLLRLEGVRPWHYAGKRITGRLNLALARGRKHDQSRFDTMMRRAEQLGVDRVVITGDLTNLSLDSEFELCREKLAALAVPCTVIPGNHDAYTRGSARQQRFESYLGDFMDGEREGEHAYPFLQRFGCDVAIIGVSTAVPTAPFYATGVVGPGQLARLGQMLAHAAGEGRARIVLIHHPPTEGVSKPRHRLLDTHAFAAVIREHGAELVLHGHEHKRLETELEGPDGPVLVHGIASGTAKSSQPRRASCFSVYTASAQAISRDLYVWNGNDYTLYDA